MAYRDRSQGMGFAWGKPGHLYRAAQMQVEPPGTQVVHVGKKIFDSLEADDLQKLLKDDDFIDTLKKLIAQLRLRK